MIGVHDTSAERCLRGQDNLTSGMSLWLTVQGRIAPISDLIPFQVSRHCHEWTVRRRTPSRSTQHRPARLSFRHVRGQFVSLYHPHLLKCGRRSWWTKSTPTCARRRQRSRTPQSRPSGKLSGFLSINSRFLERPTEDVRQRGLRGIGLERAREIAVLHRNRLAQLHLFRIIDSQPQLVGAGVGYVGSGGCYLLRKSSHVGGFATYVVLEETAYIPMRDGRPTPPGPPQNAKTSSLGKEFGSLLLSCSSAVLAGTAAAVGAAAAPVTGGGSGVITLVSGAAALASAAQCGVSFGRILNELSDPTTNEAYLDKEEWYQWSSNILDAVNLAGVVTGAPSAYANLNKVLLMRKATGKSIPEILKALSRADRKRIAKELAKSTQQLSNKQWKAIARAGDLPKVYTNLAIKSAVLETLLGGVADALDLISSAGDGNIALIVHIVQE